VQLSLVLSGNLGSKKTLDGNSQQIAWKFSAKVLNALQGAVKRGFR